MNRKILITASIALVISVMVIGFINFNSKRNSELYIFYPFKGALFPAEFPAPSIKWHDKNTNVTQWRLKIYSKNFGLFTDTILSIQEWKPPENLWNAIKEESQKSKNFIHLSRYKLPEGAKYAECQIYFKISDSRVGAPVLYRDVILPFAFAEQNLDSLSYRLVNVGSPEPPHYTMKKFMVCGNCHSSSDNGRILGLDLDAARRDKGGYFVSEIKDTIVYDTSNYISWTKLQERPTFGMFSKVSPDGRFIVTTIRDRVMSEHYGYGLDAIAFSQQFFPVNGVLAIYDRVKDTIWELPGANEEQYVQTNAFWTPDGKNIIFSRGNAIPYNGADTNDLKLYDEELIEGYMDRKLEFKFDICIIPFNNGKGGIAKPVKGASENGKSNYFPAVSPDGKWLVFCQAENYMLLNPDSKLYIVPVEGGKPRMLKCNLPLMNSWHAWSPNSEWIVFSSKGMSVYTDLFLTHINKKGIASVPVLIETVRKEGRAANYPEFVNIDPEMELTMIYNYVNLDHLKKALVSGDTLIAIDLYEQYIKQNQYSLFNEYIYLAYFTYTVNRYSEAKNFVLKALEMKPGNSECKNLLRQINLELAR